MIIAIEVIYDKEGVLCIVESVGKNFRCVFAKTRD